MTTPNEWASEITGKWEHVIQTELHADIVNAIDEALEKAALLIEEMGTGRGEQTLRLVAAIRGLKSKEGSNLKAEAQGVPPIGPSI